MCGCGHTLSPLLHTPAATFHFSVKLFRFQSQFKAVELLQRHVTVRPSGSASLLFTFTTRAVNPGPHRLAEDLTTEDPKDALEGAFQQDGLDVAM